MAKNRNKSNEYGSEASNVCPATPEILPTAPTPPPKRDDGSITKEAVSEQDVKEQARPSSPEPNCSICLGKFENMSYTDNCLHKFCFKCLLEWSKVKTECPLCKAKFKSIIHNVRADDNYESYVVPTIQPPQVPSNQPFVMVDVPSLRLPSSINRLIAAWRPQVLFDRYNGIDQVLPNSGRTYTNARAAWRRRRSAGTSEFRRDVYNRNLYVNPESVRDVTGRYRECSPSWFRNNPTACHRLVPWLNREFNVLLCGGQEHLSAHLMQRILDQLERSSILSQEMTELLQPYFTLHTEHFQHEFYNFARSVYDMVGYDRHAEYTTGPPTRTRDNDEDVIVVQPSPPRSSVLTARDNDESVEIIDVVDRVEERRRGQVEVIDLADSSEENDDNRRDPNYQQPSTISKKRSKRRRAKSAIREELGEGTSADAASTCTRPRRTARAKKTAATIEVSSSESDSESKKTARRSSSVTNNDSEDDNQMEDSERRGRGQRKDASPRGRKRQHRGESHRHRTKSRKSNDPSKIKRSRSGREENTSNEAREEATSSADAEPLVNPSDPSIASLSAEESEPLATRFAPRCSKKTKKQSRRVVLKTDEMVNLFRNDNNNEVNAASTSNSASASNTSVESLSPDVDLRRLLEKRRGNKHT